MTPRFEHIVSQISKVVLGKDPEIRLALTCLFAGGHLLIEDFPGIGKTTLAKVLARCLDLKFRRMQFTSDMLPGDILGMTVYNQNTGAFRFYKGPIFTQVFLADEINRATPKSQSALLEAMEEGQVTMEGKTRQLDTPFFVMATQNPLEQAGTFPLPESQLDRFLMRIELGYPDRTAEKRILKGEETAAMLAQTDCCMQHGDVMTVQQQVKQVYMSDTFLDYLQDILAFTRTDPQFHIGLSPRAGLALCRAAQSWAHLNGRDYTLPEDLQHILPWVAGHRLHARSDVASIPRKKLMELFNTIPVPA